MYGGRELSQEWEWEQEQEQEREWEQELQFLSNRAQGSKCLNKHTGCFTSLWWPDSGSCHIGQSQLNYWVSKTCCCPNCCLTSHLLRIILTSYVNFQLGECALAQPISVWSTWKLQGSLSMPPFYALRVWYIWDSLGKAWRMRKTCKNKEGSLMTDSALRDSWLPFRTTEFK